VTTSLLKRVEAIVPLVREKSDGIEHARRIDDEVLAAIRATGLNRAFLPGELGGEPTSPAEFARAVAAIAAADGSTAWCASIGAGSNLFAGFMDRDAAAEVYADADMPNSAMFGALGVAERDGGAHVLNGRWPFVSNCQHSGHIGLGAFFKEPGGDAEPVPRVTFVPAGAVTVEDTWDAHGLCGTGSHHVAVEGVKVERAKSVSFVDEAWADDPLFRIPILPLLGPCLGVVAVGVARGAIDEVAAMIRNGAGAMRGSLADDQIAVADFAVAETKLAAAERQLFAALEDLYESAHAGAVDRATQARAHLAMNVGGEVAVEVTSTAHRLGGGAAAYGGSRLLRALRDVQTARQHVLFHHGNRSVLGRILAGIDEPAPPFIV